MPKTNKPSALPMSGKVKAKSAYGIQLEDMPDVWLNWSKEEYRKEPWDAEDVEKGDWVDLEVSGKYIKSIAIIEPPTEESMVVPFESVEGQEDEPDPFEGIETVDGPRPRNPIATAREESIQRQVALYAAVQLAVGMQGKPPDGAQAGPLNTEFVLSIYRKFAAALNE